MIVRDVNKAVEHVQLVMPGMSFTSAAFGFVQVDSSGRTNAAVIYDMYGYANAFIHCVGTPGRPWLTRDVIHTAFRIPFSELCFNRLTCWIETDNEPSVRLATRLGFHLEALLKGAGTYGQDVLLMAMFREQCRFLEPASGQKH